MRVKKLLKIGGIAFGSISVLLVFSIAIFVFNPFEGSLPDLRYAVPRGVDFYLRKLDLAGDFEDFPAPWFWSELRVKPEWEELKTGPTYLGLNGNGEITTAIEQIREQTQQLRDQSGGQIDLLRDMIGREVQIAGRLKGGGRASWCAYSRVTWRSKFLWGLLDYGMVQDELRKGGMQLVPDGDLYKIESNQMPAPLFAARQLDCVLVGNDRELVQRSWELASGIGDSDSFGGSGIYRDGIEERIQKWETETGVPANALEFFFRPGKLFALPEVTFDDNWPDPNHPDNINERILASFVNLDSWLGVGGALVFEEASVSLLANVELNQNKHTAFQAEFFKTESQERGKWLDPFLNMVPADACAAAAMRMPPGDFLREMYSALEDAEKSLLDDAFKKTGKFPGGTLDVIKKLELAFLPRTGFAFRKNIPDPQIPVAAPSPMPQFAWVFWLRDGNEHIVNDFLKLVTTYREVIGFEGAFDLRLEGGADMARELTHPQIPATGSIAYLVYPPFFVLSNSGPFIRDLMSARLGTRDSIRANADFQEFSEELPGAVNAFVYLQGSRLEEVLLDYRNDIQNSASVPNISWSSKVRPSVETDVFRRKYAQKYGSMAALPPQVKMEFDNEVDAAMQVRWDKERSSYTAGAMGSIREAIDFVRLFESAYVQMVLEPRYLRMTGRAITRFR